MSKGGSDIRRTLGYHWQQALKSPKLMLISVSVLVLTIVLERYVAPIFVASLLSNIQTGEATIDNSLGILGGYALAIIPPMVVGYRIVLYTMWRTQIEGASRIYRMGMEALLHQPLTFHANRFSGALVSQTNKLAMAFYDFWNMAIYQVLFVVISIIATTVGLAWIAWPVAAGVFGVVVVFTIIAYFATRFIQPRETERSKSYSRISGDLSDAINNIMAVKTESSEAYETNRFAGSVSNMQKAEAFVRQGVMRTSTAIYSVVAIAQVIALVGAVWAIQRGGIDSGAVYLIITYTLNLLLEITNINKAMRTAYQISGNSVEMLDVIELTPEIKDQSRRTLQVSKGTITIDDLRFHHHDETEEQLLFDNLALAIEGGQKVGIVGSSGSGKTTLTRLLLRLTEPQSGRITIDGTAISAVSLQSLHQAIAFVPQEPLLFHRTLAENIAYGCPGASRKAVIAAAKKAQCYDFIMGLPEGFDTLVGERGVKLSGGQRQRVAIARAILKDAPILVLDEATSALDSVSEKLVQESLDVLMKGRTSIVVAHRLSTIAKMDRIIVLERGTIVEDGSHQQLLRKNGMYAKLWRHQSGGFITAD